MSEETQPEWWRQARALEAQGRLEEAEGLLQASIDHIGVCSQIAYLYELRLERLLAAGDVDGAKAAAERAGQWLHGYAASATSGGEGAALSQERDERIAAIERRLAGL